MNASSSKRTGIRYIPHSVVLTLLLLGGCTQENSIEKTSQDILRKSLQHENFFVRSAGVKAIGEMGDPAFISSIIPGFRDSVAFVRLFSVESAAQLQGPDTVKLLLAAGQDPDPMVRTAVIKALDHLAEADGQVDSFPIGSLMTPFTKDPEPTVSLFAFASLARHGDLQGWRNLVQAAQSSDTASQAIVALGRTKKKEAIPILIQTLNAPDAITRTLAYEALGEIADTEKTYIPLTQGTKDKEATVRGAAATSLGKIKDPKAIPILTQIVNDPDPMVQLSAAEGLMYLGVRRWEVYEKALHHPDYGVRHFAISSLHKVANQDALPLLTQALADDAPRVRIAAVRAIGSLGNKNEAPILEKMMSDPDLSVRAYAAGNFVRLLHKKDTPRVRSSTS